MCTLTWCHLTVWTPESDPAVSCCFFFSPSLDVSLLSCCVYQAPFIPSVFIDVGSWSLLPVSVQAEVAAIRSSYSLFSSRRQGRLIPRQTSLSVYLPSAWPTDQISLAFMVHGAEPAHAAKATGSARDGSPSSVPLAPRRLTHPRLYSHVDFVENKGLVEQQEVKHIW